MADFVGAVDQGTTSTRFMIFDHDGNEVARHQLEHAQILPRPGWVEHDPVEIWERTNVGDAERRAHRGHLRPRTSRRSASPTSARRRGLGPAHRPAVLQRHRLAGHPHRLHRRGAGRATATATSSGARPGCRRPPTSPAARSSGSWRTSTGVRAAAEQGDALFGTTDSWVLWNLTGGPDGGIHVTDVTNASRTMLMDLETLDWDDELLGFFGIPRAMLPEDQPVLPRRGVRRDAHLAARSAPPSRITGVLGDQQAATVGQVCFAPGEAKNTYGTGNFLLLNTGTEPVRSQHGLLTTVAYQFGDRPPVYALEGSIAVTGSAVQWLRDQLDIIKDAAESEPLARSVDGQRRHLLRARLLRPVRPVLALGRPRRDRRPGPVPHRRPPGPGHAGVDLLPEPRRRRGDGAGLRCAPGRTQGRRRRDRQRPVHADRRPTSSGCRSAARSSPRPPRSARPTRPVWPPASGSDTDELREHWHESKRWDAGVVRGAAHARATPAGRRRSSAPWTGWTSTDHLPHPFGRRRPASRPNGPTRDAPFPPRGRQSPKNRAGRTRHDTTAGPGGTAVPPKPPRRRDAGRRGPAVPSDRTRSK